MNHFAITRVYMNEVIISFIESTSYKVFLQVAVIHNVLLAYYMRPMREKHV